MHVYSSDNEFRSTVLGLLGVAAFVTVYALNASVFPRLYQQIPFEVPPLVLPGLAFGVVFSLYHSAFDQCLWNKSWMPEFIVAVPDLTGQWEGKIKTNYKGDIKDEYTADGSGGYQPMPATLDIEQTWSKIIIHFETERSPSVSTGASFQTKGTLHPKISYLFENEGASPDEQAEDEGPYEGTTQFTFRKSDDGDRLVGYYYTGPARASNSGDGEQTTHGSVEFTRVNREM